MKISDHPVCSIIMRRTMKSQGIDVCPKLTGIGSTDIISPDRPKDCSLMAVKEKSEVPCPEDLLHLLKNFPVDLLKIYPKSFCSLKGLTYGLIRISEGKRMVVMGEKNAVVSDPFEGKYYHHPSTLKVCELSAQNTECLMDRFPYTKPISLRNDSTLIGTTDPLGLATAGHIRAIEKFRVRPVLTQSSAHENVQRGRDFEQVVRDAAWAVFQENYRRGYGVNADRLTSVQEVRAALDAGVSMVTLDLSERLSPEAFHLPKEWVDRKFSEEIDEEDSKVLFHFFLDKEFAFKGTYGGFSIRFHEDEVKRNALLFHTAVDFSEEISEFILSRTGRKPLIDLEISIEGTPFPTSLENHLFFIISLRHRGVHFQALAPRFIGEFQKEIGTLGDVRTFRKPLYQHWLIAQDYEKYKISVPTSDDTFSVFASSGEFAGEGLYLKTTGTSWLESLRLTTMVDPSLYRDMHRHALSVFGEASGLYPAPPDLTRIPKLEAVDDPELPALLGNDDTRQLLHITRGHLLKDEPLRSRLYHLLSQYEEDYWSLLENQTEKHLESLGVQKEEK
jgi:hypothetical protein